MKDINWLKWKKADNEISSEWTVREVLVEKIEQIKRVPRMLRELRKRKYWIPLVVFLVWVVISITLLDFSWIAICGPVLAVIYIILDGEEKDRVREEEDRIRAEEARAREEYWAQVEEDRKRESKPKHPPHTP